MKILKNALFAAAAALVALPGAANAAPNVMGQSGYIFTPDGEVTPNLCVAFGYHHAEGNPHVVLRPAAGGGVRAVVISPDVNAYKVLLGLGNRLEVGYTALNTGEFTVRAPFPAGAPVSVTGGTMHLANAKLSVLPPRSPFKLVAGVVDGWDNIPQRTAYVYGSLNIAPFLSRLPGGSLLPKRFEAGAGYGGGYLDGIFVNAAVAVIPNVQLMMEWLDNDLLGVYGPGNQFNIGGRFRVGKMLPGLALDLGVTDLTGNNELTFGASYTLCFGKKKHHKKDGGDENGEEKGEEKDKGGEAKPGQAARAPLGGSAVFRSVR